LSSILFTYLFFLNDTTTTDPYTLSLHDALPISSLEAILDKFLRGREASGLSGACFGVAGPVVDGVAKITNLPWVIDAKILSAKLDRKSTRLNSSHRTISYAVFCLKKKKKNTQT